MIIFMICMAIFTSELDPPKSVWQAICYFITWSEHLGRWVKENFSKVEIKNSITINKEDV